MTPAAAGGVPACSDGSGGNLTECFCRFKALTVLSHVQDASPTANRGRGGMTTDSRRSSQNRCQNLYKLQLCLAHLVILGRAQRSQDTIWRA